MPIVNNPETDPDTILALYNAPDDETLHAEIALLTGAAQRDAINQTLAAQSSTGTTTIGDATGVPRYRRKMSPDDIEPL